MLPARELHQTGVVTSAIGFGCAGLYRMPQGKARQAMLDAAYDAGIRHFDTAPMYGLGLAEADLSVFLRRRRQDVTVTTKFGIDPTFLTRTLAPVQKPARAFLSRRLGVNDKLKTAGKDPHSGTVGRLLYSAPGYCPHAAQKSLERSLRALRTDYIDVFLLHDPVGNLVTDPSGLADYLDQQCDIGRIRCWGVTGQPSRLAGVMERLRWPAVIQHRADVFDGGGGERSASAQITHGALVRSIPAFRQFFARSPGDSARWGERLGINLGQESALSRLLLLAALRQNTAGPVLFTTTRPERTVLAAMPVRNSEVAVIESKAFRELVSTVRAAYPELVGKA
jgi:D-threo-aldose 1-dehydrogenase